MKKNKNKLSWKGSLFRYR